MTGVARRLLTDWTTTAGLDGAGLLALVVGDAVLPDALHLATLGYEVFAVTDAGGAEAPGRVHVVDVAPADVPEVWQGRFGLVVVLADLGADALTAVNACLGVGGVLVVIGAGETPDVPGLEPVVVDRGADPQDPRTERFRAVWARLA